MSNYAIVLAAGKGTRLNSGRVPKQLLPLGDEPIALISTRLFCIPQIDCVLLVGDKANAAAYLDIVRRAQAGYSGRVALCAGGNSRGESLARGIDWIGKHLDPDGDDFVLTHDAARPFCSPETILAHVEAGKKHAAVATILDSPDTVARFADGKVVKVHSRPETKLLQTPQSFKWRIAKDVYLGKADSLRLSPYTDACGAILAAGQQIASVEGSPLNVKITSPRDYEYALSVYAGRS